MNSYVLRETNDYLTLSQFFCDNNLSVPVSETVPAGMIKMWRMDDSESGELIAAATLEVRDGVPTLGDLAIRESDRSKGYGKFLQNVVFEAARDLGYTELWGNAKVPAYYLNLGWEAMDWESSPKVYLSCHECSQRNVNCFPQIIRYRL